MTDRFDEMARVLEDAHVTNAMLDELPDNQPAGMSPAARDAYISERRLICLHNILAVCDRAALRELAAAEREAGAAKWQPIETAPRDGTRILLFCDRVMGKIFTGRWRSLIEKHDGRPAYDASGWQMDGFDFPMNMEPFVATHWMPLPPTPKET